MSLDLSHNLIETIDTAAFGSLTYLNKLILNNNLITSIFNFNFMGLTYFRVANNKLEQFSIMHCPLLEFLDISMNNITKLCINQNLSATNIKH